MPKFYRKSDLYKINVAGRKKRTILFTQIPEMCIFYESVLEVHDFYKFKKKVIQM